MKPLPTRSAPLSPWDAVHVAEGQCFVVLVESGRNFWMSPEQARHYAKRLDQAADQAERGVVPSANKTACGNCEHGYIVHPPSAYDIRHGESRRLHTPCPGCNRKARPS